LIAGFTLYDGVSGMLTHKDPKGNVKEPYGYIVGEGTETGRTGFLRAVPPRGVLYPKLPKKGSALSGERIHAREIARSGGQTKLV
jgi:hypothetical protein